MTSLLIAIKQFAESDTVLISEQILYFFKKAKKIAVMPYVVSNVIASPLTLKYGAGTGVQRSDTRMQFSLFGIGEIAAGRKMETFVARLDIATLTLDTGVCYFARRIGEPIPMPELPEQDRQGQDVHMWHVDYEFSVRP